MKAITPFTGLTTIRKEMDRLFDRFGAIELPDLGFDADWAPALDVVETRDAILVKAETPGIDPKQIQVDYQDGVLTIRGEKSEEREDKEQHCFRKERASVAFARSLRLPAAVDAAKVEASFKNGLLTVTLPKSASAKPTTIPVKAA